MTTLRIYDSLRRAKVPFEPLEPGKVSMYVCGPTTYAAAHIGHAYSAICFDTIRRALGFLGYDVLFVRNVTDVDDKIIKRANETGEGWQALSSRFADEYNRDMALFGIERPDIEPRVSTHIPDVIALIGKLIDAGKAYQADGDVYFAVETFPPYGRLSGQSIEDLRAGARVEVDERKRSPVDFALWKAAKPGEPSWESPWGPGRPGWHVECSTMTTVHLGTTFDLHGGGKDLIFPHHENEIAQSQGAYGEGTFARYWLHNGFLNFSGEKMSKSLGNVFGCQQIARAASGEAMRFFAVSHHYRSPVNFEVAEADGQLVFKDLLAADRRLAYFYATLARLDEFALAAADPGEGELVPGAGDLPAQAREALADDFNTPVVTAALGEAARLANKLLDEPKGIPKPVRRRSLLRLRRDLREVGRGALGLLTSEPADYLAGRRERLARERRIDPAEVERLLAERAAARAAKEFAKADAIRDRIHALGVEVLDRPGGAEWRVLD